MSAEQLVWQVTSVPSHAKLLAQPGWPGSPWTMGVQVPFAVPPAAVVQASQPSSQRVLQQTPLVQNPVVHWESDVQLVGHCPPEPWQ